MTEEKIKTAQKKLKKHFSDRNYQIISKQTGISSHRVKRAITGIPVKEDLEFMVSFMEWELEAYKAAPKPDKRSYYDSSMANILKEVKKYFSSLNYNYSTISRKTGLPLSSVRRALLKTEGLTQLVFLHKYVQWEKEMKKTAPTPPPVLKGPPRLTSRLTKIG